MKTEVTEITINGTIYVPKQSVFAAAPSVDGLQEVMIRSTNSGVHFGFLKSRKGDEAEMVNARRVYYWSGAATLSQLATEGSSDVKSCKFPCAVPSMTVLGVVEIIPLTEKASNNLNSVPVWKA